MTITPAVWTTICTVGLSLSLGFLLSVITNQNAYWAGYKEGYRVGIIDKWKKRVE